MERLKGGQYLIDLTSIGSLNELSETKSIDITPMFNNVIKGFDNLSDFLFATNILCSKKWYAKVITGTEIPLESIVDINFAATEEGIVGTLSIVGGLICDLNINPRMPINLFITKRE